MPTSSSFASYHSFAPIPVAHSIVLHGACQSFATPEVTHTWWVRSIIIEKVSKKGASESDLFHYSLYAKMLITF